MRPDLPRGPVTLLFTDLEGSTRLVEELGLADRGEEERATALLAGLTGRPG